MMQELFTFFIGCILFMVYHPGIERQERDSIE